MNRKEILERAQFMVCGDRDKQYGGPEESFAEIAKLWSCYLDLDISPVDVGTMMILFKVARMKTGFSKDDNYIDCAGYAACVGEIANSGKVRTVQE